MLPVAKIVPLVAAAYQLIVPAVAVAPKVTVPVPHIEAPVVPVMVGIGATVTAKDRVELIPQPLPAVTVMFPFCPAVPEFTVMEVEPAPEVMDHPVGTVHV